MDLDLSDKGIVVVGGTAGMGLATAQVLAREGASLVVVGRDAERAARAVEGLGAKRALAVSADVTRSEDTDALMTRAARFLGRIDGVAILTGVIGHDPIDVDDARWREVFDDHLLGAVHVTRSALPHLMERGGSLVTVSAYSIRAPEMARLPYTALKSSVAVFTKGIAKGYGRYGIRANCVCPGAIETEALHAVRERVAKERGIPLEGALEKVMTEEWGLEVALGRPGRPDEVGDLIAFLLSGRAGYLTGALINIDGGTNF